MIIRMSFIREWPIFVLILRLNYFEKRLKCSVSCPGDTYTRLTIQKAQKTKNDGCCILKLNDKNMKRIGKTRVFLILLLKVIITRKNSAVSFDDAGKIRLLF